MKSIGTRALRLRASMSVGSRTSETARIRIEAPLRSLNGAGSGHSRVRRRVTLERPPAWLAAISWSESRFRIGCPILVCLVRVGGLDGLLPLRLAHSHRRPAARDCSSQFAPLAKVGEQARRPLAGLAVERDQLGDHRVEANAVGVEGGGHAVVAIHDPVLTAKLDEINRRQRLQTL